MSSSPAETALYLHIALFQSPWAQDVSPRDREGLPAGRHHIFQEMSCRCELIILLLGTIPLRKVASKAMDTKIFLFQSFRRNLETLMAAASRLTGEDVGLEQCQALHRAGQSPSNTLDSPGGGGDRWAKHTLLTPPLEHLQLESRSPSFPSPV